MSVYRKPKETGTVYIFEPVGLDLFDRRKHQPKAGTRVRKTQPVGTPRNGTMGHTYVEDAETGEFYGLVLTASLRKETARDRELAKEFAQSAAASKGGGSADGNDEG